MTGDSIVQAMCEAAKVFLESPDEIAKDIGTLQAKHDGLRDSMGLQGITYDGDHVQGGGCSDRMCEIAASVIDMEREIRRLKEEHTEQTLAVEVVIESLPDADERRLLMRRYIKRLPMWQVSDEMNYSKSSAYDIHRRALLSVYERLPQSYKVGVMKSPDELGKLENSDVI